MLCEALLEIEGFIKSILPLLLGNKTSNDFEDRYRAQAEFWHKGLRYDYFTRGEVDNFVEKLDIYNNFGNRIRHITYKANNLFDDTLHYHILRHEEYDRNGTPCGFWCTYNDDKKEHILIDCREGLANKVVYTYSRKKIRYIVTYKQGVLVTSLNYDNGYLYDERFFSNGRITKMNVFSEQGVITEIVTYGENNQEKDVKYFNKQGLAITKKKEKK